MKKFKIQKVASSGATFILHDLPPKFRIKVLQNKEFDCKNVICEKFNFKGDIFIFVAVKDEVSLNNIEEYKIRSIIKRAWRWYRSKIYENYAINRI